MKFNTIISVFALSFFASTSLIGEEYEFLLKKKGDELTLRNEHSKTWIVYESLLNATMASDWRSGNRVVAPSIKNEILDLREASHRLLARSALLAKEFRVAWFANYSMSSFFSTKQEINLPWDERMLLPNGLFNQTLKINGHVVRAWAYGNYDLKNLLESNGARVWVVTPKQDVRSETRILALEFPTNLILKVGNMKFSKADSLHFKVYQDKCSVSFDRLENKDIKVNSEYQIPKNSITFGWTETKQVEVSVPFCTNEFEIHSLNIEFQR